jgi:hypothetical protein
MHPLTTLIHTLNLPAGLVNSDPSFKFELSNQRLTKLILDRSEDEVTNEEFLEIEKKFSDLHTNMVSEHKYPCCIKSNSLIEGKSILFLFVPIHGDSSHKNIFIFALPHNKEFEKEEVLHDTSLWHDINNHLTILMLATSKIERKQKLAQDDIDSFFSVIKKVTTRINNLMKNISDTI